MIGTLEVRKHVADAFGALNRHAHDEFMSFWREDADWVYPGDVPASGTYEGKQAISQWFRQFLDHFTLIDYTVHDVCIENLFDVVGNNEVAVHWDVRLVNRNGEHGRNRGVTMLTLEHGKIVLAKDYVFDLGAEFHRCWGVAAAEPAAAEPGLQPV